MFHRLWQSGMISLAQSKRLTRFMQGSRATSFLSARYVAGKNASEAIVTAQNLLDKDNIRGSFYYLGEYVNTIGLVKENVQSKLDIAKALENYNLDVHISVDPTQIGFTIDEKIGHENAMFIANQISVSSKGKLSTNCLMLDMEDFQFVDTTISLHNEIKALGLPVALTLQAYLRRTETDIKKQIELGSMVRLVKGAFTAGSDISFTKQKELKQNYYHLVELMLSKDARKNKFYPVIATHDHEVQEFAVSEAKRNGWEKGEYEFEMLLGVRSDIAKNLSGKGERVRLYMPFGSDWWPYAVRRIGENPRNGLLLARSLFS